MKDRSSGRQERNEPDRKQAGGSTDKQHHGSDDADRFSGDGPGERGYRGDSPPDTPPGAVPGGSHGGGGGYEKGDLNDSPAQNPDRDAGGTTSLHSYRSGGTRSPNRQQDGREREWRDSFGAYGFPGYRESPAEPVPRSGYGEQGFGAGESQGGRWGGGERGGYGGGQPGGQHGTRGGGWAAAGQRYEQGRGPRSYGPEGWGGVVGESGHSPQMAPDRESVQRGSGWGRSTAEPRTRAPRTAGRHEHPGGYDESEAPWRKSEFAGRGEFGERDYGRPEGRGAWESRASAGPADPHTERWAVPGPYTGRGPEGYSRSEAAIREDVCERLTRHGYLDASRIRVQVQNGEVVLEGTVDSRESKRMAEEAAETVSGVRDIHNRLRIENSEF